jgi:hypothetical protein
MLSVRLSTEVSKLSVLVPTLVAVMLNDAAVMSVVGSPSSTAPVVPTFKFTLWPVAVKLPTVKSPALKITVTEPVAVTLVKVVAPALLRLNKPVLALTTVKALASFTYASPVMLSVRLATSVSKLSLLVPKLAAVMFKDAAVMSTPASPSNNAPAVLKITCLSVAVMLPTVKLPVLTLTVTLPVAVTWLKLVAPALVKLNKPVLAVTEVKPFNSFT